jgi:hypothetical protein
VIVLDYTRFHETETFKLHDLCFTIYTCGTDGQLHHEWIDFFCEASHNWEFTFEGLTQLRNLVDFTSFAHNITFWADNAFCNYGCHYSIWDFANNLDIPVCLNFFAPHHGFTLCDTHCGVGKQRLRRDYRCNLIQKPEDIWEVFAQLSNTTVILLKEIPGRSVPKHLFTFHQGGISKYSSFYFVPKGLAFCRKDSSDEEWIEIEIHK